MFKYFIVAFVLLINHEMDAAGKSFTLFSPDKNIKVQIILGDKINYRVDYAGKEIISSSSLSLSLSDGQIIGANPKLESDETRTVNADIKPLYGITTVIKENYNELTLNFKGKYSVVFRAYNDGTAYRFFTKIPGIIKVKDEEITFRFRNDQKGFFHEVKSFQSSYEENYKQYKISEFDSAKIASLPLLVNVDNGPRVIISEADLLDYPGMYLKQEEGYEASLKGTLPRYPTKVEKGGWMNFNMTVKERADYLAETQGTRAFPWRVMTFSKEDKNLLNNNLIYLLSSESKIGDASWVKPGKVIWDWWYSNNLTGVDFKTGFNTETYKYYIDFAAKNGIRYVNLDEGWSDQFDLMKITKEMDLLEVFRYAKEKNVGLILWCVWHTLDRQLIEAMDQFAKWGVAGLKIDFMDRDDQVAVNFYERIAIEAAKRKMIINYHGAFKPTGLRRTYPNVINREAVMGLEYNKFSERATPDHAVTIPFIRMHVGPMDFTPGAMTNANKADFRMVNDRPMSQGTRCNQLAMYIVYFAPLQMMADAPTRYQKEPEILNYLADVPTSWDETKEMDGKVGEYLILARRKGDTWYVGAMTSWTERNLKLDLSFLGKGNYEGKIFSDGVNAARVGDDFKFEKKIVKAIEKLTIEMAPGGGWAAKFTPLK